MPKKRILYIHHNNYDLGGSDYCLFKMVREIKRTKTFEPYILLGLNTDIVKLYEDAGIPVIIKPIYRIQKTKNLFGLFTYVFKIPLNVIRIIATIRKYNIDLIHTNDLLDFSGNLAAKIMQLPSCQHVRMIVTKPKILRFFLSKICIFSSKRLLCVSEAVRKCMFSNCHKKYEVVFDWLDQDAVEHNQKLSSLRNELMLAKNTKIIGCVGRLEEWKGQHIFLKAVDRVAEYLPNTHFVLVGGEVKGKEAYVERLHQIHERLTYGEEVSFLGHRKDVSSIMRQLDVMVHASISPDPLPGVVMEAMNNETVVVGANDGGVPEELLDGINGYLYEPGNHEDMAEKILKVLNGGSQSDKMAQHAQQYVRKKFNKKVIVEQLQRIYISLLEN